VAATPLTLAVAAIMFVGVTAYALFAGADFGGGVWDMLAGGTRRGAEPRALIDQSITPVWEANHVWLVLMLVVLWSGFPPAFAAIMTLLFVPLNLSLLGIFFRGVGFAFRHSTHSVRLQQLNGVMFAASSLMTPFFLGTVVGAITSGAVRVGETGNKLSAWTSATALLTGLLAVTACAYISAVYLVRDAHRRGWQDLTRYFGIRAGIAGTVSGLLALANLVVMHRQAPYVFHGLLHRALPLAIASVVAGTAALVLIALHRALHLLPVVAALTVATAVWGWAVAQYPYLLPATLTLRQAAAPSGAMVTEIVTAAMVTAFVVPAFVMLYWLQQHDLLAESDSSKLREDAAVQNPAEAAMPAPSWGSRLVAGTLVGTVLVDLFRRLFFRHGSRPGSGGDDSDRSAGTG
jgi:cytochrome d ubiquinol oxidase subunit II